MDAAAIELHHQVNVQFRGDFLIEMVEVQQEVRRLLLGADD